MESVGALLLARIQFAFTISFHIVFPALTIGLASFLAVLEALWLKTKRQAFLDLYHFWIKAFSICFGMGVVSGLVMAYEFGTNWSGFSKFAGGITGPLLAYEVLTAFFLEAGFLGVMLFGRERVGPGPHMFSTAMVAVGTLISSTWILTSNSWMQTPQGFDVVNGRAVPTDWVAVIFNPSFPYRLAHMVAASFLSTALVVGACGAWHLLRGRSTSTVRIMLKMALGMILVVAPLQAFIGDMHGLNTLKHQPAKLAAMEGHWENKPGESVPLLIFGWPDMESETTRYAVGIPKLGSILLTHSLDGQFPGLKQFAPKDRPNATVVFWTFRLMVSLGLLMMLLGFYALVEYLRGRLYVSRQLLRFSVAMGPSGLIAILLGWCTTEIGRQPWVVYGVMRTSDAVSHHMLAEVSFSLVVFVVTYLVVFGAGTIYLLRILGKGPLDGEGAAVVEGGPGEARQPMRPLSGVTEELLVKPEEH